MVWPKNQVFATFSGTESGGTTTTCAGKRCRSTWKTGGFDIRISGTTMSCATANETKEEVTYEDAADQGHSAKGQRPTRIVPPRSPGPRSEYELAEVGGMATSREQMKQPAYPQAEGITQYTFIH